MYGMSNIRSVCFLFLVSLQVAALAGESFTVDTTPPRWRTSGTGPDPASWIPQNAEWLDGYRFLLWGGTRYDADLGTNVPVTTATIYHADTDQYEGGQVAPNRGAAMLTFPDGNLLTVFGQSSINLNGYKIIATIYHPGNDSSNSVDVSDLGYSFIYWLGKPILLDDGKALFSYLKSEGSSTTLFSRTMTSTGVLGEELAVASNVTNYYFMTNTKFAPLPGGKALFVRGKNGEVNSKTTKLFSGGAWSDGPDLSRNHGETRLFPLRSGKVLTYTTDYYNYQNSTNPLYDFFDPATNTWTELALALPNGTTNIGDALVEIRDQVVLFSNAIVDLSVTPPLVSIPNPYGSGLGTYPTIGTIPTVICGGNLVVSPLATVGRLPSKFDLRSRVFFSWNSYSNGADAPGGVFTLSHAKLPLSINLLVESTVPTATLTLLTQPQHGTLTRAGKVLTYTPDGNFVGDDTVTFSVSDATFGEGVSGTVTFRCTNAAPTNYVPDRTITTYQGVAANIFASYYDYDNDTLSGSVVTPPAHGNLAPGDPSYSYNVTFTYTPHADFVGNDSFVVTATDGFTTGTLITVTATVLPNNHAPTFTKGADQDVAQNSGAHTYPGWATAISAGADDPSLGTQTVSFVVNHDFPGMFLVPPSLAADGTLSFTLSGNGIDLISNNFTGFLHTDAAAFAGSIVPVFASASIG